MSAHTRAGVGSAPGAGGQPGHDPRHGGLQSLWGSIRWYVRAVSGADAYEGYLRRHARLHPDEPALTSRQFWRHRQDSQSVSPGQRCC